MLHRPSSLLSLWKAEEALLIFKLRGGKLFHLWNIIRKQKMKVIVLETEIAGGEVMKEMAAMFSLTANYQVLGSFSLPWAFCYSFFSHTKQQLSKQERFW